MYISLLAICGIITAWHDGFSAILMHNVSNIITSVKSMIGRKMVCTKLSLSGFSVTMLPLSLPCNGASSALFIMPQWAEPQTHVVFVCVCCQHSTSHAKPKR